MNRREFLEAIGLGGLAALVPGLVKFHGARKQPKCETTTGLLTKEQERLFLESFLEEPEVLKSLHAKAVQDMYKSLVPTSYE
jgi:hypothetical protein